MSAARKQAGPNECPPPSPRPRLLITVVVVLGGSFSGIRQQRTGITDHGRGRMDGQPLSATDDAAAAPSESQIRPRREGGQRKLQEKEGKGRRRCDCPAPPPQSAFALRRAANVQRRKSERRLPIYLFYIVCISTMALPYRGRISRPLKSTSRKRRRPQNKSILLARWFLLHKDLAS